jgi:hypothetical protein
MRQIAVIAALMLLLSITTASAGVSVDFDKSVDFSKFKTYAWKPGTPAPNPLNEDRIHKAIQAQLAAKGLKEVDGEADCYVYSHVKTQGSKRVDMDTFGYGGYYGWGGWGGGWGTTTVNVQNVVDGTLIVDIVDAATKQLAWRGLATQTFFPDAKPEKIEKEINKATNKMFYKFPPEPQKKK